jgi:hypothetical protein
MVNGELGLGDDTHDTRNPAENERNCLLTNGPKETINAVAPAPFDVYGTTEGIFATFKPEVGGRFSEALEITQDYQFGPYGKDPPHEPGGADVADKNERKTLSLWYPYTALSRQCFPFIPGGD